MAGAPGVVAFGATRSSPEFELRTSTVTPPVGAAVERETLTEVSNPAPTPGFGLDTETEPRFAATW